MIGRTASSSSGTLGLRVALDATPCPPIRVLNPFALLKPIHRRLVQHPRTRLLTPVLAELAGGARSVLDVGAGDGALGRSVATTLGGSSRGVDVAPQSDVRDVEPFDGQRLPFKDRSFDAVLLSDVLHHARAPELLLSEASRVAAEVVVLKDHFRFGYASNAMLLTLDRVGNRPYGVDVLGRYFGPDDWLAMFARAGLRLDRLVWPLHVHVPGLRALTRSELQFAARLVR